MEADKILNLITVIIAIIYIAVMFYFLINIEKQSSVQQKQTLQVNIEGAKEQSE